ncbi:MAG: plasmid stabilization system protein RelE [Comamonadaceae bacterium]|nr:MAG: plasmid stabilization system protein RelE [Comamonadaceae bacterium]
MTQALWVVRTSAAAKADFKDILRWTRDRFGTQQAQVYLETLTLAMEDLCAGPQVAGSTVRSDIGPDIYTLHVARKGRHGRHFLVFRAKPVQDPPVLELLRLLHDSMDMKRHLPLH